MRATCLTLSILKHVDFPLPLNYGLSTERPGAQWESCFTGKACPALVSFLYLVTIEVIPEESEE